jgi:hypothetical protein
MDVYCYTDIDNVEINPQAYPGVEGDGLPGAPPPGPEVSADNLVYGDVPSTHTVLSGTYDVGQNEVTFTGCFDNTGNRTNPADALRYIGVEWTWDVQTGEGTGKTVPWPSHCQPAAGAQALPLQAMKLATTTQMNACYTSDPICRYADNDRLDPERDEDAFPGPDTGDGMPDHWELKSATSNCGHRDPFNPNDYYDVSVPRDGVIDLSNDILGVILNYTPGGYVGDGGGSPPKINFDRPGVMFGNYSHPNRGSPDHVIDLSNDILGVILQYNPGGLNNC